MAKHFHRLTIQDIKNETPDCISVSFFIPEEYKDDFRFLAGQNLTLRAIVGGNELRRSYSICSSPNENELRIAIKKVEEGLFSSHAHAHFNVGQTQEVMAPTGNFHLPFVHTNRNHYIAFASGSGITPVISLLKTTLIEEPQSMFTLVYGNRNRQSVIFREELLALKNLYPERFQMINIFSREKMDAPFFEGRIDAAKCDHLFDKILQIEENQEYLICGPASMIFSVKDWLQSKNISQKKIHFELFSDPGASFESAIKEKRPDQSNAEMKSRVTIRLDGITTDLQIPFNGPSILDTAIQAGADLPYACRAGVCATCRAKLILGRVLMDQNYSLAEEELEQGFILTCQAHPDSEKLIVDFDIR